MQSERERAESTFNVCIQSADQEQASSEQERNRVSSRTHTSSTRVGASMAGSAQQHWQRAQQRAPRSGKRARSSQATALADRRAPPPPPASWTRQRTPWQAQPCIRSHSLSSASTLARVGQFFFRAVFFARPPIRSSSIITS